MEHPEHSARPLGPELRALHAAWMTADRQARSANSRSARLSAAREQARCSGRFFRLQRMEASISPAMRAALVRESLWDLDEAIEGLELLDVRATTKALLGLFPLLGDKQVEAVRTTLCAPGWATTSHLSLTVWSRGEDAPDDLRAAVVGYLLQHDTVNAALEALDHITLIRPRVVALHSVQPHLAGARWRELCEETLDRACCMTTIFDDDDPDNDPDNDPDDPPDLDTVIVSFFNRCEASTLFEPARAVEIVHDAVDTLPRQSRESWRHLPGGLRLVALAVPVIHALDRDGARHALAALAIGHPDVARWVLRTPRCLARLSRSQQTQVLSAHPSIVSDAGPPNDAASRALDRPRAANQPNLLRRTVETLPRRRLQETFDWLCEALDASPSAELFQIALRLTTRLRTASARARFAALFTARADSVVFEADHPIWGWPNDVGVFNKDNFARVLTRSVRRARSVALQNSRSDPRLTRRGGRDIATTFEAGMLRWEALARWDRRDRGTESRVLEATRFDTSGALSEAFVASRFADGDGS